MRLLLKRATICDKRSPHHLQTRDLLIEDGKISAIGQSLQSPGARELEAGDTFITPGWFDMGVKGGEPGDERIETISSLLSAAAAGGFTGVALFPDTISPVHSQSEVQFLLKRAEGEPCRLYPIGALSHGTEGKELAELLDMLGSGAIAISDGLKPVQHGGLLLRALQYLLQADVPVVHWPMDKQVFPGGQVHESAFSTALGMRGIPSIAETMMMQRDIELLRYSGSKLHFMPVSTAEGVALIRAAKQAGLRVSAAVSAWHLAFDEQAVGDFDSLFKLAPPLRSQADRDALIEGVADGTIDAIFSLHVPVAPEHKMLEFPYAKPGAISLQTAVALSIEALSHKLPLEDILEKWSIAPKSIYGLDTPVIDEGQPADLTWFDTGSDTVLSKSSNLSLSENSPLFGRSMKGAVLGTLLGTTGSGDLR